ncbi:MAG: acetate--CoA ligase family protein [Syntrophales bacterium]|jgi:acetyltransferase|nr:acetate--CoA ligase family protein [Syntrophales bacterium]MDY0045424.1 acetate--CoA ligase family protein [Syntrophales bacterium]
MRKFFHPDSIAVIGASERPNSLGNQIIINLLYGYEGRIFPVNPKYKSIMGIPSFASVESIPDTVDLAIIIVPASAVPSELEACARKGIDRVMIQSAGFSEVGSEGKILQEKCSAIANAAGVRLWGPNCMGLVDIPRKHLFTFMHPKVYEDGLIEGRISLIVQSGMLSAGFLADLMSNRGIGVGKACSIGNKMDIDECDIMEYLLEDDETDAVALYLESIPRGRRFAELAKNSHKPIVLLKGGKSSAGSKAALSHTASLAGNAVLQDSVFEMAGVTIAQDFQQMMELAFALATIPHTPWPCRTAVLTFSGGAGILSCDLLEEKGLTVTQFSSDTIARLNSVFPEWLSASNPVDLFPAFALKGPRAAYAGAFDALLKDADTDVIFLHYFAGLDRNHEAIGRMKEAADSAGKILVFWVIGRHEGAREFRKEAQKCGIPVSGELSRVVECLAAASRYKGKNSGAICEAVPELPVFDTDDFLKKDLLENVRDEYESKRLLEKYRIPVVEEMIALSFEDAKEAAVRLGFPVVMKGLLPGRVHKTESGLVRLGIADMEALRSNFTELEEKIKEQGRIIIQRNLTSDYELIAGFLNDNQFGPVVMFGMGGVFSELQKDVVFTLAPLTREDALRCILRIKNLKLLQGYRGMAPLDCEEMAKILVNLGNLGAGFPQIEQIDINPFAVVKGSPIAVDATVVTKS